MKTRTWIALATLHLAAFLLLSGCIPGSGGGDGDGNNGVISDAGGDDTGGEEDGSDPGGDTSSTDTSVDSSGTDASGTDTGGGGGLQGLQGYCAYYFECGGSYYSDAQDCVDQSIDYWGECRRDELDTFGDCMLGLTCEEWGNPDAYNPSNTDCADEWNAISESPSCG